MIDAILAIVLLFLGCCVLQQNRTIKQIIKAQNITSQRMTQHLREEHRYR